MKNDTVFIFPKIPPREWRVQLPVAVLCYPCLIALGMVLIATSMFLSCSDCSRMFYTCVKGIFLAEVLWRAMHSMFGVIIHVFV